MPYVQVLLPTIVLALIFWFVMRGIFNADRREREAEKRADAEYAERLAAAKARRQAGAAGTAAGTEAADGAEGAQRPE
ncbi:MAG: hypothetical protein LBE25_00025 [Arthrobacter sp.]|nr:hypothetical protein [Arthrobacter sp.]